MKPVPIIFDWIQPINTRARSRKTDPSTSHAAAKRVELGKAERQRMSIRGLLNTGRQMTVAEMAEVLPWSAHELDKRVGECNLMPTGEKRNGFRVWAVM